MAVQFHNNQEFFDFVHRLARDLEQDGNVAASAALADGISCINGLTDGWADFLEAVEKVQRNWSGSLSESDAERLERVREAAQLAVYRR